MAMSRGSMVSPVPRKFFRSKTLNVAAVSNSGSPAYVAISSDCSPTSEKTTSGTPSLLTSPIARSVSLASLRSGFVGGERLQPLALAPGFENAEAIGPGDQEVVVPVAVEIGDVKAREVDRAEQKAAVRPVDSIFEHQEQERLGGPVEQDDFLVAVALDVDRRGTENLRRVAARRCTDP